MTNPFALTTAMIQRRDDIKMLLADRYEAHVGLYRETLRDAAAEHSVTIRDEAFVLCIDAVMNRRDAGIVIAALVDELEVV